MSALESKTTEYGNIDVNSIQPDDGLVHVPIKRLQQLLGKLDVDFRPAYMGTSENRGYYSPIILGVVISISDKPKLDAVLATRLKASNSNSLTAKQIAKLEALGHDDLIAKAIEALHALNRRAKKCRDQNAISKKDEIYHLKDRFFDAAIRAGIATLETFEAPGSMYYTFHCPGCNREWRGPQYRNGERNDVNYCRSRDCYDAEVDGDPMQTIDRWYVVTCLGYRFHLPNVAVDFHAKAAPCEAHDPNQPQREIPKCGLTIEAQHACIKLATAILSAAHA